MASRALRFLFLPAVLAVIFLATAGADTASAQPSTQIVANCPVPQAVSGVEVCVDRGEGALYYEGDPISICVTVNIAQIAVFPPPPDPLVRVTSGLAGGPARVVFEQRMSNGQRCINATVQPPTGNEVVRAEVIGANGQIIAGDTVTFRSAPRGGVPGAPLSITVDRGPGGVYYVGNPITICVNAAAFGGRPVYVRAHNFVNGYYYHTLQFGYVAGTRCTTTNIRPPVGQETLRAEAVDPATGRILGTSAVSYLSR